MKRYTLFAVLASALFASGCESPQESTDQAAAETEMQAEQTPAEPQSTEETEATNMTEIPELADAVAKGLIIEDIKMGEGQSINKGTLASLHYTGWLYDESKPDHKGDKFDSSYDRGQPLARELGVGNFIPGWDFGVLGMKEGGKRRLVIPSELGYGQRGTPGGPIPPNATLIFEVEVVDIP